MKKIFETPYRLAVKMMTSLYGLIDDEIIKKYKSLILLAEIILLVVIAILSSGLSNLFTKAYEATTVGGMTTMLFSFANNKPREIFGIYALVCAGLLQINQDAYSKKLSNCAINGFELWIHNLVSVILSAIVFTKIVDFVVKVNNALDLTIVTALVFFLAVFLFSIGIVNLFKNFWLMVKCIIVGTIAEYLVLFLIFILVTPLLLSVTYVFSKFASQETLLALHLYLTDLKVAIINHPQSIFEQKLITSIVFFVAYNILYLKNTGKDKEFMDELLEDEQIRQDLEKIKIFNKSK